MTQTREHGRLSDTESLVVNKLCSVLGCRSPKQLYMLLVQERYDKEPNIDVKFKMKAKQLQVEGEIKRYARYARYHHTIFMSCMELTVKKIHPENLVKHIIKPAIEVLTIENQCSEGIHALKELLNWVELEYDSFLQYCENYWHDRTKINDMIKRLEVKTFMESKRFQEQHAIKIER